MNNCFLSFSTLHKVICYKFCEARSASVLKKLPDPDSQKMNADACTALPAVKQMVTIISCHSLFTQEQIRDIFAFPSPTSTRRFPSPTSTSPTSTRRFPSPTSTRRFLILNLNCFQRIYEKNVLESSGRPNASPVSLDF